MCEGDGGEQAAHRILTGIFAGLGNKEKATMHWPFPWQIHWPNR
jgi:hypothetical protein